MATFTVTLQGGDAFRAADAPALTQRIGARLAQAHAERVAERAQALAPRDTGTLAGSVQAQDGVVTVGAPYGADVHGPIDGSGRGDRTPGRLVSIDQLLGWSLRHGLSPWSVQFSILTKGTPYQPFVADALDQVRADFPDLDQAALAELGHLLLHGGG